MTELSIPLFDDVRQYITSTSPLLLVYGAILVLIIVYSSEIPLEYKQFADSSLGRVIGIAIVYGTIHTLGWVYGLLVALAFLLLLHGGMQVKEGFYGLMAEKETTNKRWYVERILGKPDKIVTDQVQVYR
jgi:hypothetical protein